MLNTYPKRDAQSRIPECSRRPTAYTCALADTIFDRLVEGDGLREVCRDPIMPTLETVRGWLLENKEFQKDYAFALEARSEDLSRDTIAIVDDSAGDYVKKVRRNGNVVIVLDRDNIARSKLRCQIRHWVADHLVAQKPVGTAKKQVK
jgi:hypothetical protein